MVELVPLSTPEAATFASVGHRPGEGSLEIYQERYGNEDCERELGKFV